MKLMLGILKSYSKNIKIKYLLNNSPWLYLFYLRASIGVGWLFTSLSKK